MPVLLVSLLALVFGIGGSWFVFMKNRGKDYVTPFAPLQAIRTALLTSGTWTRSSSGAWRRS